MTLFGVEVIGVANVADDVRGFTLAPMPGAAPLPPYAAGAHIDVEVRSGLLRQYSLCGPLGATTWQIAVFREPASRGGSAAMFDEVGVGNRLRVGPPRNLFALRPGPGAVRLLAGGIGVTPILAMARTLAVEGRAFRFWYAGRSRSRMAFVGDIAVAFAQQARIHVDDEAGRPLDLSLALADPGLDEQLYICGPPGMIAAAVETARIGGWSADRVNREVFAADPGPSEGTAFAVRLARQGRTFEIPGDRTVLDVLRDEGVELDYSCEQGVCGACVLKVVEGVPDHRDLFLCEAERAANDCFTPCCSRSLTRELVIDL